LLKGRLDIRVGQKRPFPVFRELEQTLGERVGVALAEEEAAVLPKRSITGVSWSHPSTVQTNLLTSSRISPKTDGLGPRRKSRLVWNVILNNNFTVALV
jgi:hypothetical protein